MKSTTKLFLAGITIIALGGFIAGCGGGSRDARATIDGLNIELNDLKAALEQLDEPWVAEDNEISLLPEDERAALNGATLSRDSGKSLGVKELKKSAGALATSIDWRSYSNGDWTTSIKNQKSCGSCVAFASVAVVESLYNIVSGDPTKDIDLAESDLFSCGGAKCASGWYLSSAANYFLESGVSDEACLAYTPADGLCASKCSNWETRVKKTKDWSWVDQDVESIKAALASGPVLGAIQVYTDFYYYKSGVYRHVSGKKEGGHAIAIVGYNDAGQYWIVKNSWGTSWGESGYVKIGYGQVDIEKYVIAITMENIPPTVTASVSSDQATLYDGVASVMLTCSTTGTVTYVEYRCDSDDSWAIGASRQCDYSVAGTYTPECRVNGELTDAVDTPVTVMELIPVCGNGAVEGDEACDDGNLVTESCDYGETACEVCNDICEVVDGAVFYCGDGGLDGGFGEACDDGNNDEGDGCDPTCRIETVCGDNVIEGDEQCEDGNTVTEACDYGETSCTVCDENCLYATGTVSFCGDGTIDTANSEVCDDGNTVDGDGCTSTCEVESVCGDSIVGAGEQCDDGNAVTEACAYGETDCQVCTSACQNGSGVLSYCGDGVKDALNGEGCDDGNTVLEDCDYGLLSCVVCGPTCKTTVGNIYKCGDGTVNTEYGEQCDDGNILLEACSYGETSCTVCNSSCKNQSGATSYCGDGVITTQDGEQCDDGNSVTEMCAYGVSMCSVCDSNCRTADGAITYCGDNYTDTTNGESCDDGNSFSGDGCSSTCIIENVCGNGILETGETCDDGNAINYDGCTTGCDVAADVSITFQPLTGTTVDVFDLLCQTSLATSTVTLEGRCDTAESWQSVLPDGTLDCSYTAAGSYTPGCRVDSLIEIELSSPITVTQ